MYYYYYYIIIIFIVVIAGGGCKKRTLLQNVSQWENQVYAIQFHDMHTFLTACPFCDTGYGAYKQRIR